LKISDYPDEELISLCIAGQQSAWEELIARYEKLIYSTALRTGLDSYEADEVFQNVCMIWLKELKHLRQANSLGAWLVTTTRRECWAFWRHNKAKLEELDEQIASDELPEALAQHVEDSRKVLSAFKQLGEPCHQLLWRLYFNEEPSSYTEIARDLNIPANSIGPTRSRCLEKLKSILISMSF
jgi:RNA polymerase sigma factor (sigma-70 family)